MYTRIAGFGLAFSISRLYNDPEKLVRSGPLTCGSTRETTSGICEPLRVELSLCGGVLSTRGSIREAVPVFLGDWLVLWNPNMDGSYTI